MFWDRKSATPKKLDAIDTDQITPAADCVSESLETLDERWKAGSFRYLMPDFRARVHRGETFVIAGDRFAIGSSREMSPAGLKGVAEEVGQQMVVVCGHNMGDIFRRNAFNLGLHVVQSPEAVADAQDGDELTFDPVTRQLGNVTQGKTYEPVPLSPKEEEIRRGGGIFEVGRREFRRSVETAAGDRLAGRRRRARHDHDRADHLGASRRQGPERARPEAGRDAARLRGSAAGVGRHGAVLDPHLQPDHRRHHDLSAAGRDRQRPFRVHRQRHRRQADRHRPRVRPPAGDCEKPYYATPGDGIFHFYFPEQGLVMPGQFIPGADSHSRAYGAYGAVGIGVGSTTLGFGWATGYIYFTLAKARRVVFNGRLQPWVSGKDIVLELLRRWGAKQSQGMSVELVDANMQLPIAYRNTIANMMAEAEALNGIFAPDETTYAWYRQKGITTLPYPPISPGADARYEIDENLDSGRCPADDREAVQPGQRVSGRGGRARADHVRQGDDRVVHERQLRRPAAGRAGAARRARRGRDEGRSRVPHLPGIGRRARADRAAGRAARRRVDRRGLPLGRRRDPPVVVRAVLRAGTGRADRRPARDHVVQPELAEPHGPRRRRLPRQPRGRRRLGARRLHGAASELGLVWDAEVFGV